MTKTATIALLVAQVGKSLLTNNVWKAAVVHVPGMSDRGLAAASASVLKDVATLTRNGTTYTMARATIIA